VISFNRDPAFLLVFAFRRLGPHLQFLYLFTQDVIFFRKTFVN
jgi:hypothetical protein